MQEHLHKHFVMEGHKGFLNEVSLLVDKTDGKDPKKTERYWVQILNTMEPYGLNIEDSVSLAHTLFGLFIYYHPHKKLLTFYRYIVL